MLPATLAEAARINVALGRPSVADQYFDEASEIASGVIASVGNLIGKDEFINSLDQLYLDHFRFHANARNPGAAFEVAEQVHGRAVADALRVGPNGKESTSAQMTAGEKRIAHLQLALMRSTNRVDRLRLLDSLLRAEEGAYPAFISLTKSNENPTIRPFALRDLQRNLGPTMHSWNTCWQTRIRTVSLSRVPVRSLSISPARQRLKRSWIPI